jgi:hypothetical protein
VDTSEEEKNDGDKVESKEWTPLEDDVEGYDTVFD